MKLFFKGLLVFLFFLNISCGVNKTFRKDVSLSIDIDKDSLHNSDKEEEHPYYYLKFYIHLVDNYKKVKYPFLEALYPHCIDSSIEDDFDYNQKIDSWSDILSLKTKYPLFILENEKGDLKYFKNFKTDKDKNRYKNLKIYRNQQRSHDCLFLYQRLTLKNEGRVNNLKLKPGKYYFGTINIYQIDLKVTESDSLARLHYVTNNQIISSNWIKLK